MKDNRIKLQELKNAIANKENRYFHIGYMPSNGEIIISCNEMTMFQKITTESDFCERHSVPDDVGYTSVISEIKTEIKKIDLRKSVNWLDYHALIKNRVGDKKFYSNVFEDIADKAKYETLKNQYEEEPIKISSNYFSAADDDGGFELYEECQTNNCNY